MTKVFRLLFLVAGACAAAAGIARADVGPKWTDDDLARFSRAIVSGRVADIATGRDIQTGAIHTYVTIALDQVYKGDIPEREIVVKQLGGLINDEGLAVFDQAAFALNENVLLFLEARPRDGTLYTSALWQGKWVLERDAVTGEQIALRRAPDDTGLGVLAGAPERRAFTPFADRLRALGAQAAAQAGRVRLFQVSPSIEELSLTTHAPADTIGAPFTFLGPYRWNEFDARAPIPVDVQSGGQPGLSGGGTTELSRALNVWAGGAPGLSFASGGSTTRCFGAGTRDGHISMVFMDPCGDIDNSGGVLAVGGAAFTTSGGATVGGTTFGRVLAGYLVDNDGSVALQFLQNANCFEFVNTHEIGHVMGMGHSADTSAIMFASVAFASCSSARPVASADDLAGIRAIYLGTTTSSSAPGAPTSLTATSSGSTVTLTWVASTTGGTATAYTIEAGSQTGLANLASFSTGSTATSFSAPGVASGTYFVRVKGTNAAGSSPASNEAILTVGGGCSAPPGAPTALLVVTNSGGIVTLSWGAATGVPTTYIVEAGSASGLANLAISDLGGTGTSFTATGVARGTYFVRMRARNLCGTGAASNELVITVS